MTVECLPLGEISANCYYVTDGKTAILIDVGEYGERLKGFLKTKQIKPSAVLLTHGHFDHICGTKALLDDYDIPVYISSEDKPCLYSEKLSLAFISGGYTLVPLGEDKKVITLTDNEKFSVGSLSFTAISLKGHTAGGMGYLTKNSLFSGDTVFCGSIGRTDLPTSSITDMRESIKKVKSLPDDTVIYSGHGDKTTVAREKEYNYYFK